MAIIATTPVTVPSTPQVVFNSWFITQLICKFSPTSGPTIVTLQRATQNEDGSWTLMPNSTPNSSVTFNLDLFAQEANFPEFGTAISSVTEAIVAYATSKHLL